MDTDSMIESKHGSVRAELVLGAPKAGLRVNPT